MKWQERTYAVFLSILFPGLGEIRGGRVGVGIAVICGMLGINLMWIAATGAAWSLSGVVGLYAVLRIGSPVLAGTAFRAKKGRWWVYLLLLIPLFALDYSLSAFADVYTSPVMVPISGHSMNPAIEDGDRVLVEKRADIDRGDMVNIVDSDGASYLIKRVIGLPGERVEIRNLKTYIDGVRLDEPYAIFDTSLIESRSFTPRVLYSDTFFTVGNDSVFFMGDNRFGSTDSRMAGALPFSNIEGKARFILWPPSRIGALK